MVIRNENYPQIIKQNLVDNTFYLPNTYTDSSRTIHNGNRQIIPTIQKSLIHTQNTSKNMQVA